jgi:hypothetical protein
MVVNENARLLAMRGALETIASELAPTPTAIAVFKKAWPDRYQDVGPGFSASVKPD